MKFPLPALMNIMGLLDFISEIGKLKDVTRTGWEIYSVKNPESVSDHSFRLAILSMLYAPKLNLDTEKCIKMALIHDIHEVYTKDIAIRARESNQAASNKEKEKMEKDSVSRLLSKLPLSFREELSGLWQEFHSQSSEEACLVNDLDKIEMVLQAFEYKKDKRSPKDLEEFFQTSEPKIKTQLGKKLWNKVREDYLKIKG